MGNICAFVKSGRHVKWRERTEQWVSLARFPSPRALIEADLI
jgi:hypothetical protein